MESNYKDPWLGGGGGRRDHSFGSSYATSAKVSGQDVVLIPMSLLLLILSLSSVGSGVSFLIVEVDVVLLPRGFFKGPKWVSLNSAVYQFPHVTSQSYCHLLLVRFHDMISNVKWRSVGCVQRAFCRYCLDGEVFIEGNRRWLVV